MVAYRNEISVQHDAIKIGEEIIANTATAALLVPILAIAGISMRDTLQPMGGVLTLLVGVALGSSLAMVLPISTPPNALAHATGMIKQKDMEKVGLIMGAIGLCHADFLGIKRTAVRQLLNGFSKRNSIFGILFVLL